MKESIAQTFEQLLKEGVKLQKEAKIAQQRANSSGYLDASRKIVYRNPKATSVLYFLNLQKHFNLSLSCKVINHSLEAFVKNGCDCFVFLGTS